MRKNMNECSVIAGRQGDASIVCSWIEDAGSTICEVWRFLERYQTAENVEHIFLPPNNDDQKETDNGKNKFAESKFLPEDKESWRLESEDDIFDLYSVEHYYLYEWDQNWYYIFRGPGELLVKIPLQLIINNTGKNTEDEYLHNVQLDALIAIFEQRVHVDASLRLFLAVYVGEYEELLKEIWGCRDRKELGVIYQRLNRVFASCGRWIVIEADTNNKEISCIATAEEHNGVHIETCLW